MDTPETTIFPTWGYRPDGEAGSSTSKPASPARWLAPSPTVILDPSRATAQALTDRAAGRPYAYPQVKRGRHDPRRRLPRHGHGRDRAPQGHHRRRSKENEDLVVEITKAEDLLAAAAAEVATMRAALEKAQADGAEVANRPRRGEGRRRASGRRTRPGPPGPRSRDRPEARRDDRQGQVTCAPGPI